MPKINLPVRVEPGLYDRLKRQAGEKSLSAHVEGLLETMLAKEASAARREAECAEALQALSEELAAAQRRISQACSDRDALRAALTRSQQQATRLEGERDRLSSRLAQAHTAHQLLPAPIAMLPRRVDTDRIHHARELAESRLHFLTIGLVLCVPVMLLMLLLAPHDTMLARGVAHLALAPFGDARVAAVRLLGEDAAFAWLYDECPIVMEAIRRSKARRAALADKPGEARSAQDAQRGKGGKNVKRKLDRHGADRQPTCRPAGRQRQQERH